MLTPRQEATLLLIVSKVSPDRKGDVALGVWDRLDRYADLPEETLRRIGTVVARYMVITEMREESERSKQEERYARGLAPRRISRSIKGQEAPPPKAPRIKVKEFKQRWRGSLPREVLPTPKPVVEITRAVEDQVRRCAATMNIRQVAKTVGISRYEVKRILAAPGR